MRLAAAVLALAACKGGEQGGPPAAGSGSSIAPAPALQLVGCAVAEPRPSRMRLGAGANDDRGIHGGSEAAGARNLDETSSRQAREVPPAETAPRMAWTPFATAHSPAPPDPATTAAAEVALRARLGALDACFASANGSVRAMLAVTADGHVGRARVGGLGVPEVERCLAGVLGELALVAPAAPVELACDLSRGGPQPWRVSPSAYSVISVDASGVVRPDDRVANPVHLVLAAPDAPGALVEQALSSAGQGALTLVAVTAAGGAPVFVGIGPDRESTIEGAANLGIAVTRGIARVCTDGAEVTQTARVIDPGALDRLIAAGLAACAPACSAASVGVVGDFVAKDLVAVTAAARRAKLATIVGGQGCPR